MKTTLILVVFIGCKVYDLLLSLLAVYGVVTHWALMDQRVCINSNYLIAGWWRNDCLFSEWTDCFPFINISVISSLKHFMILSSFVLLNTLLLATRFGYLYIRFLWLLLNVNTLCFLFFVNDSASDYLTLTKNGFSLSSLLLFLWCD